MNMLALVYPQTKSLPGQRLNNLLIPSVISVVFHNPDNMIIEDAKIKIVMDRVPFLHGGKSNIKLHFISILIFKSKLRKDTCTHVYAIISGVISSKPQPLPFDLGGR